MDNRDLISIYRGVRLSDPFGISPREAMEFAWSELHESAEVDVFDEYEFDDIQDTRELEVPVDVALTVDPRILFRNERRLLSEVYTDDPYLG